MSTQADVEESIEVAHEQQDYTAILGAILALILLRAVARLPFSGWAAAWEAMLPDLVGAVESAQVAAAVGGEVLTELVTGVPSSAAGVPTAEADVPAIGANVPADGAGDRLRPGRATAGTPGARNQSVRRIDPDGFAGVTLSGMSVDDLLRIPIARAEKAVQAGMDRDVARAAAGATLEMYARSEVADAGRDAITTSAATRGVTGYVRIVGANCCARCAILSGRWYPHSAGFDRHPNDKCVNLPAEQVDQRYVDSPYDLFRDGRIRDLTEAERRALEAGANMSQVVNSRRGMYRSNGETFTHAGSTRRGIAGARLLAAELAKAKGESTSGAFRNTTFTRAEVAVLRRLSGGKTPAPGRLTVASIFARTDNPGEQLRLLINNGYVL